MASKPQIAVAITATDELSPVLAAIKRQMATAGREARDFGRDLDKTLSKRGLSPTQLTGSVGGAVGRAGMIPGLGALAGAGSIAGIGEIITHYTSMGVALGNTARVAGTTAQGMNTLRGSARLLGLSSETANQAMTGLNTTIADAFYGKNPQAAAAFQQFGIGLEGLGGKAKKAEDVLPRIADEVQKIAKVDPRAAITLMNALGISPDAMPLLMQGAEGLKRYREEVQRLDPITADGIASSQRFAEAIGRMGVAGDGLARTIANAVEPHVTPLLTSLSTWVSGHSPDIDHVFERIGNTLEHVDWKGIELRVTQIGDAAKYTADRLERMSKFVGEVNEGTKRPVRAVGGILSEVNDFLWRHGWDPNAGFRDVAANNPQVGAELMRRGLLPGPEEGMSIPPPKQRPVKVTQTFDTTLTPAARGLLDTIAGTESPGYNTIYGGGWVNDLSHHPNIPVPITSGPHTGETSSAAGRYQFLKGTWDEAKDALGLTDFSPANQDRAGWWLAQRDYKTRTGRDLSADLKSNDPAVKSQIGNQLHDTWTSLPGGIEAGTTDRRFNAQLDANTAREKASQKVITSDGKDETKSFAAGARPQPSTVQIDINHNDAPRDITMDARASGGAEVRQVRVVRAMPLDGHRRDRE